MELLLFLGAEKMERKVYKANMKEIGEIEFQIKLDLFTRIIERKPILKQRILSEEDMMWFLNIDEEIYKRMEDYLLQNEPH
jgi:hypothetical protein